jgi:hypothetical protein
MEEFPAQADLLKFSTTASPDEERLLQLYRRLPLENQTEILYRVTRRCLADYFTVRFDDVMDSEDSVYGQEELEDYLRGICPMECLGGLWEVFDGTYFECLWVSAWGRIAPVILGASEQDGQRADELFRAVNTHCAELRLDLRGFQRGDALRLIESWREQALQNAFSASEQ